MIKPDETDLWNMVKDYGRNKVIDWEACFKKLDIPQKRGYYILSKWDKQGKINWGISIRWAWLE